MRGFGVAERGRAGLVLGRFTARAPDKLVSAIQKEVL